MRCVSCNVNLSDSEATRKHSVTGEYFDMCTHCLREVLEIVSIPVTGNMQEELKDEQTVSEV